MLHVPDVRATAAWYEDLGFTVERTHDDDGFMSWALLSFGPSELMFNEGGRTSDEYRREVDLYLHVDRVAELYTQVRERVEVVEPLYDAVYGMREFIIRDQSLLDHLRAAIA